MKKKNILFNRLNGAGKIPRMANPGMIKRETLEKLFVALNQKALSISESHRLLDTVRDCMGKSYLKPEIGRQCDSLMKIFGPTRLAV